MQLDWFPGRSILSEKLLRTLGGPSDYDEDVAAELGTEAVPAFRYALACFERLQRSTGEPAICHTADVAIRAADLGLPSRYIVTALLHDCVEDTSGTPGAYAQSLMEIERRFGRELRDNVRLLTNRYNIIVNQAIRSLGSRSVPLPMEADSLTRIADEMRVLQLGLDDVVRDGLSHEYKRLGESLRELDLAAGIETSRINRRYTISTEIALHIYGLFIDDMVDDFKTRNTMNEPVVHDVVMVVKFMDAVDNLRTSAATDRMKLEKILRKTQIILDRSFHLHEHLYQNKLHNRVFPLTYEFLKYTLVEQIIERRRALQNLADTRFAPLCAFFDEQIAILESKYKIEHAPPERLRKIREDLRALHSPAAR